MEGQSSAKGAPKMSKDEDETDEQQRRLGNCLQQVLINPLVCEKIASFLSLSDMKAASEVNRHFLQAIRGTRRFAQEAVLAITDKNAQKATLQKTEYSWRGVRIDVTNSSHIVDDLPRFLQSAEFVSLGAPPGKMRNVRRIKDPRAASVLTTVLNLTPALSHLQIDTHFLGTDLRPVLSSPAVQETLRNLSRLDILKKTHTQYEGQNDYDNEMFRIDEEADEEKKPFEWNLRLLTELPSRLKTFCLTELFPEFWKNKEDSANANQSVLRLLRNNTTTIEQLSLHGRVSELHELRTITFPVLKSLSAIVHEEEEKEDETLAKFLENQRSLEELTVELTASEECLVPSIRCCCMELKKLDLTTDLFSGDVEGWSVLGSMSRLKEFLLKILQDEFLMDDGVTNGWRLLAFLPKNQLERLSLEGISTKCSGFWSMEGGVETELSVKTELLEGFRCLRTLSFGGSRDTVDDQLMQWLLKEFPSLEELQISDCSKLTDAGISGNTTAEWGRDASFADLRRLKMLKVVRCGGVTPNGVLESCVNVPWLESLEYSNPPGKIVKSAVMKLMEQNPRLKRLSLEFRGDFDDFESLVVKVKNENPRVKLVEGKGDDWW